MSKTVQKVLVVFTVLTVLISIISLVIIAGDDLQFFAKKELPQKIKINGFYHVTNSNELKALPENNNLGLEGINEVVITGNFNKDIPKNATVILRIDNLQVRLYVNDNLIYSFGEEGTFPKYADSAGNVWSSFLSPGIKSTDEIKIALANVYDKHVNAGYENLLENIQFGNEGVLITNLIRNNIANILSSMFVIFMGIIAGAFSIVLKKIQKSTALVTVFACLSICCGIWFFIDFNLQSYIVPLPTFNNAIDIISLILISSFLMLYVCIQIKNIWKKALYAAIFLDYALIIIFSIMQLIGFLDYYEHVMIIYTIAIITIVLIIIAVFFEKYTQKINTLNNLIASSLILCAGMVADTICNILQIIPYVFWFKIGFFIFLVLQFIQLSKSFTAIISENAKVQVLAGMAYKDALTGVQNKAAYIEKQESMSNKLSADLKFAVMFFDVNNLKKLNDTLGHEKGDILIKSASKIICDVYKKSPVYRIGGDEFVVVLESQDYINREQLTKELDKKLKEHNLDENNEVKVSMAVGIAAYDYIKDINFQAVVKRAENIMYENKRASKMVRE